MSDQDAEAVAALRVVAAYDALTEQQAPLADAVGLTADLVGVPVYVRDDWNGLSLSAPGTAPESPVPSQVPRHGAEQVDAHVVAPVSVADGRVGVVWTAALPAPAHEVVRLAVERLAAMVAMAALHRRPLAPEDDDPLAVVLGLSGSRTPGRAAAAARRCCLPPAMEYVPVAAVATGSGVAGQAVAAALGRHVGGEVLGCGTGPWAALVIPASRRSELAGRPLSDELVAWGTVVGVGAPCDLDGLAAAWAVARSAVAFADPDRPVVSVPDLGALALLAELPIDMVDSSPDVRAVESVAAAPTGDEDVRLLRRYCETSSLRETAAAVHLHHSSVDYRLKKLQATLGFSLDTTTGRLRALMALQLWSLRKHRGRLP
jgi:hypothetical protein